jgi:hypothetical protein
MVTRYNNHVIFASHHGKDCVPVEGVDLCLGGHQGLLLLL